MCKAYISSFLDEIKTWELYTSISQLTKGLFGSKLHKV